MHLPKALACRWFATVCNDRHTDIHPTTRHIHTHVAIWLEYGSIAGLSSKNVCSTVTQGELAPLPVVGHTLTAAASQIFLACQEPHLMHGRAPEDCPSQGRAWGVRKGGALPGPSLAVPRTFQARLRVIAQVWRGTARLTWIAIDMRP